MVRTVLAVALSVMPLARAAAEDFKPRVCQSAVEYVGEPLHAAVASESFDGLDQSLHGELAPALVSKLDDAIDWVLKNTKAPGITAAVGIPGQGLWATTRGMAIAAPPTPVNAESRFHWASAGKTFTAAVVMQLVEEGKLHYDDRLARWFPDFPNAGAINIEHLLTHTNGIFSFNADLKLREEKGYHPPERLLHIAARHGCVCCPGERWYYSNTGYVLLARIVEEIEGRPYHEVLGQRLTQPLGLTQTIVLAPQGLPKELAVGHVGGKPDADFDPSTPFGAGAVCGTAHDMVVFWQAFLSGKVIRRGAVEEAFARLYPMFEPGLFYGRGVMLTEFTGQDKDKVVWLGHSGGTPGIKSVIAYDVNARFFLAVALNGDVSAEACANKLRTVILQHRAGH